MAIGSDVQWRRLVGRPHFASLATEERQTNEGRTRDRRQLHADVAALTATLDSEDIMAELRAATIPHARINGITAVRDLEALRGRLTTTTLPDGRQVRMQPQAVELPDAPHEFPFAPKYAEHTRPVLAEAGFSAGECAALAAAGVIPA